MIIDTVITSVNFHPDYLTFAKPWREFWSKMGKLTHLCYVRTGDEFLDEVAEQAINPDSIHYRIENMDYGIQAKLARFYTASQLEGTWLITDVDMMPTNRSFLKPYESVPQDHLVQFGVDHFSYQRAPDIGKWPSHGVAGSRKTLQEILRSDQVESMEQLVDGWKRRGWQDPRCNPDNNFSGFSDESLMRELVRSWNQPDRISKIMRTDVPGEYSHVPVYGRLCRSHHHSLDNVDVSQYYEAHGPRPYHTNKQWYNKLKEGLK